MSAARALVVAVSLTATLTAGVNNDVGSRFTRNVKSLPTSLRHQTLNSDLTNIFDDPVLARALVGARVESLTTGEVLYQRNADKLVMPASNMKLLTTAVAAERLGWNFTCHTRLEAAGVIADGVLHGDLVVVGGGDPSIASQDFGASPMFGEWANALVNAGIHRVDGRIIGDGRLFDHEGLGAGWGWDDLADGYAAPSGALSYNENVAVLRAWPGAVSGAPVRVELTPPGHGLELVNELKTVDAASANHIELMRLPGSAKLTVRGTVPAGGAVVIETASVESPTRFFVEALRLALADRGIRVSGGARDISEMDEPPSADGRRVIAERVSPPLSELAGYFMKVSQNFYAEMLLKSIAHADNGQPGTAAHGRDVVRDTLASWGIAPDAFVMADGSGLSRYNYVTADAIVAILKHMWRDEKLRGPFAALLPVAGHDGTLDHRMKGTVLDGRVEAKTGTIANVRALSGYLETTSGERLVFAILVNNFTAPSSAVDAVVEKALARLAAR